MTLAHMGARVIFHAVNGGRGLGERSEQYWRYHESNLCVRARAGRVWIVSVDNCWPLDRPSSSPSGAINPEGQWGVRTQPQGEDFFAYTVPLD